MTITDDRAQETVLKVSSMKKARRKHPDKTSQSSPAPAAMAEDLMRDFLLGFIKIHILHHAGEERIYGKEFHGELNRHGYDVSYGTIYPVFHRLEKSGYLESEKETVNGKIRKYYSLTTRGRTALDRAREMVGELFREISG